MPTIRGLPVPCFSRVEQDAIAEILGSLDDKIELNRETNQTLIAVAQAIFRAWFIDFEPVRAKMAGATGFRDMPSDVFSQLPERLTGGILGDVPDGWSVTSIGELVEVVGGATPSTSNPHFWQGGQNPFCTPKDMAKLAAPILLDTERHITQAGMERISSRQLPAGTVLMSSRAPIGYLALAATPVSVNQGVIAMLAGRLPNSYMLLWAEANMEAIKSRAGGSTFAEISKRSFRTIPAVRPDDATLRAFDIVAKPIFDLIAENERESVTLAAIRDTMLPKLLSGEAQAGETGAGVEDT
ncbi:restriction endonuclease subunit S [Micromonospora musae]|uniref:restriction endonuclease subunit S n=1 Tax=Micromonospora musae TaxID=1894970 RepID=UPI00340687BD